VKCTVLEFKCNVLIRNNIVLKKKTCAREKIFSTKISGRCNVTGAILLEISTKNDGNCNNFRGQLAIFSLRP
jgi:hypothetical protein